MAMAIQTWTQSWLKNGINLYVSLNQFFGDLDLKVGYLIDHNSVSWKNVFVKTIFNPSDAKKNIVNSSFKYNGRRQAHMEVYNK